MSPRRAVVLLVAGVSVATAACHTGRPRRPQPAATDTVDVGYSQRQSGDAGGGVQAVNYADAPDKNVAAVEELLIGRFSGVEVQRTGDGGFLVFVRGTGSFMASEQPLWVIDGVPYESKGSRGLSWLSPANVGRITVLRNPQETAIYGVRGANGVIVITTRKQRP